MSAKQSDLTLPEYAYDLVVAATQDSVNATTKEFLADLDGQEFIACYKYDDASNSYALMDYEPVAQAIGGDPFAIPNDADQTNPSVQKLDDLGFEFAFKAKMGLPGGVAPTAIPDVVVLDQGNAIVTYQLFFAEFSILVLEEHHRSISWTNLSQPDGAPWVFRFNVNLDMRSGDDSAFGRLPPGVQNQVKNLNPGSAFSVQQLYLDLNTAGLQSSPDIEGLDPSSDAYVGLTRIFLNTYWRRLQQSGDVLLGYAVKPETPNPAHPSIIPTDLTIEVSPNLDAQGAPDKQYGLYTLDYLVMSDNHVLPAPVQFEWNWVDASEEADYNGAMAIKKSRFSQYLNQVLSPALNEVCLVPSASISIPDPIHVKLSYGYGREPAPQTYREVSDGTSKVLTFSYSKESHDSDTFVPLWGNISLSCATQSDVYFENNLIRTVTLFTGHVHINVEGGVTDGNFVKYQVDTSYQLNVDEYGNLVVSLTPGSPKLTDLSDTPNPDGWSKFVTLGDIDDVVSKIKSFLGNIQNFLTGHDQSILRILEGSSAWVFPGGKTFAFKNVYFSDHQDLVTHVTYVEPT